MCARFLISYLHTKTEGVMTGLARFTGVGRPVVWYSNGVDVWFPYAANPNRYGRALELMILAGWQEARNYQKVEGDT